MNREGAFKTEHFERYQRNEWALIGTLADVPRGREHEEGPRGHLSPARRELLQEHRQPPGGRPGRGPGGSAPAGGVYPCLMVDARYEHVRFAGQFVSQGVLVARGLRKETLCELLAVSMADGESEATHVSLFRGFNDRCLRWCDW